MCYVCRKPVPDDYTHFYGQGADPQNGKCPLWSDNKNLHKDEIYKAANKAKKEINRKIKYDPTKGIEKPPEGFDGKKLHNIEGDEYMEDEEYSDDEVDEFVVEDSDDEDGYFPAYRRYDWNPYPMGFHPMGVIDVDEEDEDENDDEDDDEEEDDDDDDDDDEDEEEEVEGNGWGW
jgi:hypothetical protein